MELTKQDRKHINEEVNKLAFRIVIESREYAQLYEREYLEALAHKIQERIDVISQVAEGAMKASEPNR